jgi:hypothetical protein
VFCGVLTAPALAAGGGAGMPISTTVGHASPAAATRPTACLDLVPHSDGGSLSAITPRRIGRPEHALNKSADGTNQWSQFSGLMVSALQRYHV